MKKFYCLMVFVLISGSICIKAEKIDLNNIQILDEEKKIFGNVIFNKNSLYYFNEEGLIQYNLVNKNKNIILSCKNLDFSLKLMDKEGKIKQFKCAYINSYDITPVISINNDGKKIAMIVTLMDKIGGTKFSNIICVFNTDSLALEQITETRISQIKKTLYGISQKNGKLLTYDVDSPEWKYWQVLWNNTGDKLIFEKHNLNDGHDDVGFIDLKSKNEYSLISDGIKDVFDWLGVYKLAIEKNSNTIIFSTMFKNHKTGIVVENIDNQDFKAIENISGNFVFDPNDNLYTYSDNLTKIDIKNKSNKIVYSIKGNENKYRKIFNKKEPTKKSMIESEFFKYMPNSLIWPIVDTIFYTNQGMLLSAKVIKNE